MRKLVLILMIIVSIAFVSTSGAYTNMTMDRSAEINVVNDSNALLALSPCTGEGNNGSYFVDMNGDGAYELRITSVSYGLNVNSDIVINNIFTISNNSTRTVTVTLTDNGTYPNKTNFGSIENGIQLEVGQSVDVSMTIDTEGIGVGVSLIDSITIHAE